MRLRTFTMVLVAILFALIQSRPAPASAEDLDTPLLLVLDGDIQAWREGDSALEKLTNSGGVVAASLSPDGRLLAYAEIPTLVRESFEANPWAGLVAYDIRLLNLATGEDTLVAGQPDDIQVTDPYPPYPMIDRTMPVWSPDSTMLAWTELHEAPETRYTMIVYSLAEQQAILDHQLFMNELIPIGVNWGAVGIEVLTYIDAEGVCQVLDIEGNIVVTPPFCGTYVNTFTALTGGPTEYLIGSEDEWGENLQYFEPVTGELTAAEPEFEVYSLSAPEGVSLLSSFAYSQPMALNKIQLQFPGNSPVALPDMENEMLVYLQDAYPIAISPDGKSVAYLNNDLTTIVIARDGEWIETGIELSLTMPIQLLWSPLGWRVPEGE